MKVARLLWQVPVVVLLALAIAAGARSHRLRELPYYSDATFTPQWIPVSKKALARVPRVGEFALTDQTGARITHANIAGRVAIVNFFYTRCGDICPITRDRLRSVASRYVNDDRVVLLSHTVTPGADSTGRLAEYAAEHKIDGHRWHLLTGPDTTLRRLSSDSYHLLPASAASWGVKTIEHTERVLLIDQQGRIRGVYNGTLALEMENLRSDLDLLLAQPTVH